MNNVIVKRTMAQRALCLALGACLSMLASTAVTAANSDGSLVGRTRPGAVITVTSPDTGFSRTVTADANGNYRFPFLPVGNYQLQSTVDGQSLAEP